MRKAHTIKAEKVEQIKEKITNCAGIFLTDYQGLTVKEITELRGRLREAGGEYRIIKNNLVVRAVKATDIAALEQYLSGPTAVAFAKTDPVRLVKVLVDFIKEYKKMRVKAGVIGSRVVDDSQIKEVAILPPKEVLIAQVLGGLKAPLSGVVGVLSAPLRGLLWVLKAIEGKK